MTIKIGNSSIKRIQLGNTEVKSAYLGSKLVYGSAITNAPSEPAPELGPDDEYNIFVFDTSIKELDGKPYTDHNKVTFYPLRAGDTTYWDGFTDWGDGTVNNELSHTYAIDGIYTVKTKYVLTKTINDITMSQSTPLLIKCLNVNKRITDASHLFEGFLNLESVDLRNLIKYGQLNNTNSMFAHCKSLKSINLTGLNTSNVKDMSNMFCRCESLTILDLSSFNTNNLTITVGMFSACLSLTSLNLSNFNMDNVDDYRKMFVECDSLTLNNITMTGCSQSTINKITTAFNNRNS